MQSGRHRLLTVHICQEEENDAPRALLVKTEKKEEPSLKKERRTKPQERRQKNQASRKKTRVEYKKFNLPNVFV